MSFLAKDLLGDLPASIDFADADSISFTLMTSGNHDFRIADSVAASLGDVPALRR